MEDFRASEMSIAMNLVGSLDFFFFNIDLCVCVYALHEFIHTTCRCSQRPEWIIDPLELELDVVIRCGFWDLKPSPLQE